MEARDHTFHFSWGEMAPTLEDVSLLLGLPLAGEAIGPLEPPDGWAQEIRDRFAGLYHGAPGYEGRPTDLSLTG